MANTPVNEKYGMRYETEMTLICGCCKNKIQVTGQELRTSISTRWGDATDGWQIKSVGILGANPALGWEGVLESDYLAEKTGFDLGTFGGTKQSVTYANDS